MIHIRDLQHEGLIEKGLDKNYSLCHQYHRSLVNERRDKIYILRPMRVVVHGMSQIQEIVT